MIRRMRDRGLAPEIELTRADKALADARARLDDITTAAELARADEYATTQGDLASLRQRLKLSQDQLSRTILTAPMRGIVNRIAVSTIGGVVRPGEEILQIIPLDPALFVEAKVKPADIAALGALPYSQDGFGPTLEDVRKGLIGKIGENMSIRRFKRFASGQKLASYLHGTRIGVVVEFEGDEAAAKDVAMHVAAMKPVSLTSADVPAELIERERSVATAKAAESGKPAEIAAKMIEGSVQKYLKEVSLFNQPFVKNDKQTVEQMLKEKATSVKGFTLYVVGEGIEKRVDDFAAEVAAQVAAAKGA
jgi:hypothetical protein